MVVSVCVDVTPVRSRLTGIGHYTLEVVKAIFDISRNGLPYGSNNGEVRVDVFDGFRVMSIEEFVSFSKARDGGNAQYWGDRLHKHLGIKARAAFERYGGAVARRYHGRLRKRRYDVFHAMNFFAPAPLGRVTIPEIYDMSVLRHPNLHPEERVRWFNNRLKSIAEAPRVLTISEFSAREIVDLIGIPRERIHVAYPGVDARFFERAQAEDGVVLSRFGISKGRYVLSVSTLEPRKNLRTLVDAYCRLPAERRAAMPLVLVGGAGWGEMHWPAATEALVRDGQIRFTGYVDDVVLRTLYRGAAGFFYPSIYEGYGMPVTEALACGSQVVAASGGAVEEAALGQGLLVDPLDTPAWTRAFEQIGDEAAAETEAMRDVRRAAAATRNWRETARITRDVYIQAAAT
ncbi:MULTISPECIES: glycosyltransferase family 1 protein [unclassified Chelatococcus]|uniref:glycosyltransferase family 4 protein n=1 Tax=unclassified Chelatococcus TaxID=2638111 RepID=UPI001BCC0C4B|nr:MULTISPECIES: glycosyltransferase family 1 protein [unclassified Chelatococcus]MBS7695672.1 glycosyltransferase family 4 protein [Chelatococcus sp. YT9]MBX3557935.1 glycosyltransferase family 4 protein [Chelatococcus sp.]